MAPNKCVCPSGFTGSHCEKGNLSPFVGVRWRERVSERRETLSSSIVLWVDLTHYVSLGDVAPQNGYV